MCRLEVELEQLKNLDIIERATGPTPWVSPFVVGPKKTGGVKVCTDMRKANKGIQREKQLMPIIDDLTADISLSKVISKLVFSSVYHQFRFEETSPYVTTFTTHVGLYHYKRLLFDVNEVSKIFQKAISDLLRDIPGIKNLSDDIVHEKNQETNEKSLSETLKHLLESEAKVPFFSQRSHLLWSYY